VVTFVHPETLDADTLMTSAKNVDAKGSAAIEENLNARLVLLPGLIA
jgi:hypothetical protein